MCSSVVNDVLVSLLLASIPSVSPFLFISPSLHPLSLPLHHFPLTPTLPQVQVGHTITAVVQVLDSQRRAIPSDQFKHMSLQPYPKSAQITVE